VVVVTVVVGALVAAEAVTVGAAAPPVAVHAIKEEIEIATNRRNPKRKISWI
jgi:hypothetical protein